MVNYTCVVSGGDADDDDRLVNGGVPPPPLGGGGNSVAALTSPWHASHYCPPLTSQRGVMG